MRLTLFREPVLILLLAATGLLATAMLPVLGEDPFRGRDIVSVWPVLALGGVACFRYLRAVPYLEGSGWIGWWGAGLLAYLVHLWFALGATFGWNLAAAAAAQGWGTVAANLGLLALWSVSVVAAAVPREPPWERALHALVTLAFAALALWSTLLAATHPVSVGLGAALVALWSYGLWLRLR